MMTQGQVMDLSRFYHIDEFSIRREYLQLLFLSYLYQHKKADDIYFKGGTAIHLLFDSPRFSEDLDFSTTFDKKNIKSIINDVQNSMKKELNGLQILLLYTGSLGIRYRIKYVAPDFKYPFVIRLDFSNKKAIEANTTLISTRFPIVQFPVVRHVSSIEILAEKIRALYCRSKGRDIFDVWYLLEKGVTLDNKLIRIKIKEIGDDFQETKLLEKIKNLSDTQLRLDLAKFLPITQKKIIPLLKESLFKKIKTLLK